MQSRGSKGTDCDCSSDEQRPQHSALGEHPKCLNEYAFSLFFVNSRFNEMVWKILVKKVEGEISGVSWLVEGRVLVTSSPIRMSILNTPNLAIVIESRISRRLWRRSARSRVSSRSSRGSIAMKSTQILLFGINLTSFPYCDRGGVASPLVDQAGHLLICKVCSYERRLC